MPILRADVHAVIAYADFQYSIRDADITLWMLDTPTFLTFNTPLEMQIVCGLLFTTSAINFQYSIRDAALKEDTYAELASLTFNTPLEMLEGVLRGRDWRLFFQYSIRDVLSASTTVAEAVGGGLYFQYSIRDVLCDV
jgi:hypothetical protein